MLFQSELKVNRLLEGRCASGNGETAGVPSVEVLLGGDWEPFAVMGGEAVD